MLPFRSDDEGGPFRIKTFGIRNVSHKKLHTQLQFLCEMYLNSKWDNLYWKDHDGRMAGNRKMEAVLRGTPKWR